ncbi:RimJ/RimL family protein N-acetyltransferase [Priestia taiwanensis]|uniref:N-acetyltransferase domain-containing protein n=2 Tax=Priestia taiwanensis TaxID=1347902 RepID=A0A917AXH8_9BACI|nr:RimJ/RimL family protein N-acetyltransferase [Priestia taiwanensis]GGE79801.1 hypothetical protein GCM10007140_31670 [Priestia taiwanensis]
MSECTKEWFSTLVANYKKLVVEDKAYLFDIFRKEDGAHLGSIDFSTLARDYFQWARIGYTIHNQHWRQGYAKEAVEAALELAFNELTFHRIEAHISFDNEASIHLAKSVGMEFECIRKGFLLENEDWIDTLIYYINAPE